DEFDPATGRIEWPKALRGSDYGAVRSELARLFESRARSGQMQNDDAEIRGDVRKMTSLLQSHVRSTPANDYMAARKFLDGLDYSIAKPDRSAPRPGSALGRDKQSPSPTVRTARLSARPGSELGGG